MVPLLKFYFHEEVRQAAVQAVPELLKSVYMAVSEGKAGGADMQYVKQMLDYVWQPLIESMVKVGHLTSCPSLWCSTVRAGSFWLSMFRGCFSLTFYHQGLLLSDVPPSGAVADTHQIVSDWHVVAGSILLILSSAPSFSVEVHMPNVRQMPMAADSALNAHC